eukprot:8174583-Pyramimonas_sp.AAC.2
MKQGEEVGIGLAAFMDDVTRTHIWRGTPSVKEAVANINYATESLERERERERDSKRWILPTCGQDQSPGRTARNWSSGHNEETASEQIRSRGRGPETHENAWTIPRSRRHH